MSERPIKAMAISIPDGPRNVGHSEVVPFPFIPVHPQYEIVGPDSNDQVVIERDTRFRSILRSIKCEWWALSMKWYRLRWAMDNYCLLQRKST